MAQKTRAAITTEITTTLPDNTTGAITPELLRTVVQDLNDSAPNISTDGTPLTAATAQASISVLAYNGTSMAIDFAGDPQKTITVSGTSQTLTFTTANRTAGKSVTLFITNVAEQSSLAWPAGWVWIGAAAPTTIAASKHGIVTVTCTGTTDASCYAAYSVEP